MDRVRTLQWLAVTSAQSPPTGGIYAKGVTDAVIQVDGEVHYTDDEKAWPTGRLHLLAMASGFGHGTWTAASDRGTARMKEESSAGHGTCASNRVRMPQV